MKFDEDMGGIKISLDIPTEEISSSSINILPSSISASLNNATAKLDLPAPVLPAMPIFSLAFMVNDTPLSTKGKCGRYLSWQDESMRKLVYKLFERKHVSIAI